MKVIRYQILWFFRRVRRKLTGRQMVFDSYAGKKIQGLQEANDKIAQWIREGRIFAAGRLGGTELEAVWRSDVLQSRKRREKTLNQMKNCSGFFPQNPNLLKSFTDLMKSSCTQIDLLAVWFNRMEDYVVDRYGRSCELTDLTALEPWYVEKPWTSALKGKRVLVIHPFVETIRRQYEKRGYLFENRDTLPEFKAFYTVKAVQTIAGAEDDRFENWFEALDWMFEEAMKTDFEVAIIGCGAYGFPLATRLKEAGRSAVHMGGAVQLLFGIKGKRWDRHPVIGRLYNEYWVRPSDDEKPVGAEGVEGGCYW